jgi:hypothetical protein
MRLASIQVAGIGGNSERVLKDAISLIEQLGSRFGDVPQLRFLRARFHQPCMLIVYRIAAGQMSRSLDVISTYNKVNSS